MYTEQEITQLITPTLGPWTSRLAEREDLPWITEAFEGSFFTSAEVFIVEPVTEISLVMTFSRIWSHNNQEVLFHCATEDRIAGKSIGHLIAVHPNFRGQNFRNQLAHDLLQYAVDQRELNSFHGYYNQLNTFEEGNFPNHIKSLSTAMLPEAVPFSANAGAVYYRVDAEDFKDHIGKILDGDL